MLKKIITFLIILAFLSIVCGCSSHKPPIKIGYTGCLSGRQSQLAVFTRAGIQIALDEINEKGGVNGRQLKLIVKDNKEEPDQQQKVIAELIEEGVGIIIGPLLSKMASSTLEAIADKNVLFISPTVSTDRIKGIDDGFIRIMPVSSIQGKTIANELIQTKLHRIAVVYDSSNKEYTVPVYNSFKNSVIAAKRKIVYVNDMSELNRDYYKIAKDIKRLRADSLFIITSSINAAVLCQQLQKLRYLPALYGSYWVKAGNIIQHGGKSVEGMIVVSLYEPYPTPPNKKIFDNKIRNIYKQEPAFNHDAGYDSLMLAFEGIKLAKSLDPLAVKKAIISQSVFNSLHGKIVIDRYGDVQRKQSVVKIKGGKYQHVKHIDIK